MFDYLHTNRTILMHGILNTRMPIPKRVFVTRACSVTKFKIRKNQILIVTSFMNCIFNSHANRVEKKTKKKKKKKTEKERLLAERMSTSTLTIDHLQHTFLKLGFKVSQIFNTTSRSETELNVTLGRCQKEINTTAVAMKKILAATNSAYATFITVILFFLCLQNTTQKISSSEHTINRKLAPDISASYKLSETLDKNKKANCNFMLRMKLT